MSYTLQLCPKSEFYLSVTAIFIFNTFPKWRYIQVIRKAVLSELNMIHQYGVSNLLRNTKYSLLQQSYFSLMQITQTPCISKSVKMVFSYLTYIRKSIFIFYEKSQGKSCLIHFFKYTDFSPSLLEIGHKKNNKDDALNSLITPSCAKPLDTKTLERKVLTD